MAETPEATWLTQEAYDRLASELEYLLTVARQDIAKKIQEAREEGDLKENGGYHAAKEEQGKIEARAARLENILANAEATSRRTAAITQPKKSRAKSKPVLLALRTSWQTRLLAKLKSLTESSNRAPLFDSP